MKQIAQHYKSGELSLLDVPVPSCKPGGVLVRTAFSVISPGTEIMKVSESKLSLLGKARARPDQVKKVINAVRQQGLLSTFQKVMNRLDSYTPLGYSLAGVIVELGAGVEGLYVGQAVACAGNQYALHAEYNWVPENMCAPVPSGIGLDQAAFTTIGAIALQGLRQADVRLGETACVIGLGLIGQILVRILRSTGVQVVGIDIVPDRCRAAEAAGAAICTIPGAPDFARFTREVAALTGGHGVDCVFITAGGSDNKPVELAAELARDRARVVDIGKCRIDLPWNAYYEKELEFRFSRSYGPGRYDPIYEEGGIDYPIGYVRWTERRNMECVLGLLRDGRLDFAPLITHVFPFESAVDIYERMNKGDVPGLGILFRYPETSPVVRRLVSRNISPKVAGQIRLGVIGAGNYVSSMLLPHLVRRNDVALMEVVTNTALSAANAVRKFGFARSATDSTGLMTADDIDALLIGTRHATHAELVCAALRAGKAVFVEKPLAITRESLSQIVRTIEETGNDRLMVGFNRRFSPLLSQLKQEWERRIGPHMIHYRINAGPLEKGSWYLQSSTEGSRFVGEGGHFIDTVSWWLEADPLQVTAAATVGDQDNLSAIFRYPDGSLATISYLTDGDARLPKERIEIFGEGKVACFDNFSQFVLWQNGRSMTRRARTLDKGQQGELDAFISAVKGGDRMPVNVESLLTTTAATIAVQESVAANMPISLASAGHAGAREFKAAAEVE
ncbi:MAG: bi-domain-containing oxidoreductase [Bradyrhizobiaceae bacterium]|nr:bi-domain-containing oxidoreductase [Bradyrhizobiaceae bacterium]